MAPPDEPTAEEDLLERLESPPCQHRVADPGGLPEVTLDGSRADPGVDVGECRRDDRGDLGRRRSEEHTSELQSQSNLVCRLLLEKKKINMAAGVIRKLRQLRWYPMS